MRRVIAYRANKILFNFIKSNNLRGTIILPANICPDVIETLTYSGCNLHFIDIDINSLCLDLHSAMHLIKEACALLYVHTYGVENNFNEQFNLIRQENPDIAIIDDRCLCLPELQEPNSTADVVIYSTCAKKQVDLGIGGIGYVSGRWKYEEVHVTENDVLTNEIWNLDSKSLLTKKDAVIAHKEKLNAVYRSLLPKKIQLPEAYQHWRFNILVPNKEEITRALFNAGLFASGHYAPQAENCAIASNLYNHVINLFNDFYYTEEQAILTCKIINEKLKQEL